jgi:hypothetical protein
MIPWAEAMRTIEIGELEALETIDPRPTEPWSQPVFDRITIEPDKDKALDKVAEIMKTPENVIFTDASAKDSALGAAVIMLNRSKDP